MNKKDFQNQNLRNTADLCLCIEQVVGEAEEPQQLQHSNGAFLSSLGHFLDDNPGCIEAIQEWMLENCDIPEAECIGCGDEVEEDAVDDDGFCEECQKVNEEDE